MPLNLKSVKPKLINNIDVISNNECVVIEYTFSNNIYLSLNPTPGYAKNTNAHNSDVILVKL